MSRRIKKLSSVGRDISDSEEDKDAYVSGGGFKVLVSVHYHAGKKYVKGDSVYIESQAKADKLKASGIIV